MPKLKLQPPAYYGIPSKFTAYRDTQRHAIVQGIGSSARFVMQAMPTGSGKSLSAITQAIASYSRTAYLTSTKALQSQLLDDFASIGLVDVRGQSNYECIESDGARVDEAPCHFGHPCRRIDRIRKDKHGNVIERIDRDPDLDPCLYFDAVKRANTSELVVTNYAYWLNAHRRENKLGEFDLLILDEAHNAGDELASFLSIEFTAWEIEALLGSAFPASSDMKDWQEWAKAETKRIDLELKELRKKAEPQNRGDWSKVRRQARLLRRVKSKLDATAEMAGEWVCEVSSHPKSIKLDLVWPSDHSELLFQGIPKVLLMSATIRPKTADLLGIDPDELSFLEYPHTFPLSKRPTYCIPTVGLSAKSTNDDLQAWVRRIDQIITSRSDRKGIVHTTSYSRRNFLLEHSRNKDRMITHDRRNTAKIVAEFKTANRPLVLVSPSVTTGYDFPGDECEYQILGKVPFLDMRPSVMKARRKKDKEYDAYNAMQSIVQAAGRGVRSVDDQCEVFVVDDHFGNWFVWANQHLCPKWFLDSVKKQQTIPSAPPSMFAKRAGESKRSKRNRERVRTQDTRKRTRKRARKRNPSQPRTTTNH